MTQNQIRHFLLNRAEVIQEQVYNSEEDSLEIILANDIHSVYLYGDAACLYEGDNSDIIKICSARYCPYCYESAIIRNQHGAYQCMNCHAYTFNHFHWTGYSPEEKRNGWVRATTILTPVTDDEVPF